MTRALRACALFGILFTCLGAGPAQAALKLCNKTSYVLYAAVGAQTPVESITQGWSRVVPGDCKDLLPKPLTPAHYFLYARSSRAHAGVVRAWGGTVALCVKDSNFLLKSAANATDCPGDDAYTVPFAPVDTHAQASWTSTLTESDAIDSMQDARAAGLTRLLGDAGYKITDNRAREAALKDFRKRMKLAANASSADYFDALETDAMKVTAPAGYWICNDTTGGVWAALALKSATKVLSAGWWKVVPGGCAHALTQPLKLDMVFVHAESHNKAGLVSGRNRFCITNVTFQTENTDHCTAHGLNEAGFAATNTKGLSSYTVHIGEDGLLPSTPVQAGMPK